MGSKPEYISKVAVDGDIISYRASFATQGKSVYEAYNSIDDLMGYITHETVGFPTEDSFKVYLTGKGNFRYTIAKSAPYKGNRQDKEKPEHLVASREYLISEYGAVVSSNCEADDLIAMEVMNGDPESTVIASVDKDFKTVHCWMFNFVKNTWEYSTEWDALKFFYTQVLTGDNADNIKGLHRVGPKKAEKMLEGATTEVELYKKCVEAYEGDIDKVIENARLLHLQRYPKQLWSPPYGKY